MIHQCGDFFRILKIPRCIYHQEAMQHFNMLECEVVFRCNEEQRQVLGQQVVPSFDYLVRTIALFIITLTYDVRKYKYSYRKQSLWVRQKLTRIDIFFTI
jgi:hypothetical protein